MSVYRKCPLNSEHQHKIKKSICGMTPLSGKELLDSVDNQEMFTLYEDTCRHNTVPYCTQCLPALLIAKHSLRTNNSSNAHKT